MTLRATDEVVAPTRTDPLARVASAAIGGPLGWRALSGRSWWTPLRVVLCVAIFAFGLGVLQKSPCVVTNWVDAASPKPYSHMCYSDLPYLYVGRGLAVGIAPYTPRGELPANRRPATQQAADDLTVEYPVLIGVWMGLTGTITNAVGRHPDLSSVPTADIGGNPGVQYNSAVFWDVNAVGFFLILLAALLLLVRAQPRRPWDALFVAASPSLVLAATINWDMLALGCVVGAIWAWSRRRPVLAGMLIGLGVATKVYPLFLLGPLLVLCWRERRLGEWGRCCLAGVVAWLAVDLPIIVWAPHQFAYVWTFNASRGPDWGSLWLLAENYGHTASAGQVNLGTWLLFGAACVGVALVGLFAPRRPRWVQLAYLVVAAFLLVNKVYSPQYVLWLLPLAVLARPRWRDLLIWQACEVFYFFAIWMHLANFFVAAGTQDWVYNLAILVRVAGELYLAVLVLRDIFAPSHDPVRADGLSDDPLGGVLDDGIDAEPAESATPGGPVTAGASATRGAVGGVWG
ncbi:MAG TPA: glycosyltransferase 87 family protein [Nocardioidaceae bacterium]|nr:glycosyltransferase 87 family protein [Nocardioidaceae bacterium]